MKQVYLVNADYPVNQDGNIIFCRDQKRFAEEVKGADTVVIENYLENFPLNSIENLFKYIFDNMQEKGRLVINGSDIGMLINLTSQRQIPLDVVNQRLVGRKSYLNLTFVRQAFDKVGFKMISCSYTQNCGFTIEVEK